METLSPLAIAAAIGAPVVGVTGCQDWTPDTHPHLTISELVVAGQVIPFRVTNRQTGVTHSKIAGEVGHVLSVAQVDAFNTAVMNIQQVKNGALVPAVVAAIPDLDPAANLAQLTVGGKAMVADLVAGALVNVRAAPVMPTISIDGNGKVAIDLSNLTVAQKAAVRSGIAKLASASAISAVG